MSNTNELGQPIGAPMPVWPDAKQPNREPIEGRFCRLEPIEADRHAEALHQAYALDREGRNWTYLPYGPFASAAEHRQVVAGAEGSHDTLFFAIVDLASQAPVGVAAYLRVDPAAGSIEVGHLSYSRLLQRTPVSTEAMYLMMRRVFDDWGYRRYEWKCNSLNAASVAAARRLGFRFEGLFRNHFVSKGQNRDTTWLSIIDAEWPGIRDALEAWLAPANFDDTGDQRTRLGELMPASAGKDVV